VYTWQKRLGCRLFSVDRLPLEKKDVIWTHLLFDFIFMRFRFFFNVNIKYLFLMMTNIPIFGKTGHTIQKVDNISASRRVLM
jgi:hypothetical protein